MTEGERGHPRRYWDSDSRSLVRHINTNRATTVISNAIINKMGETGIYGIGTRNDVAFCTVGVFIDVAVITVAPVALSDRCCPNLSPSVLLLLL